VAEGRIAILNQEALALDALELGYSIEEELESVLSELLGNSTPTLYVGTKPPQKSYERAVKDLELFAFEVASAHFRHPIYFKFTIKTGMLWLVSLHLSKREQEVG
jgi:hypothetical protein